MVSTFSCWKPRYLDNIGSHDTPQQGAKNIELWRKRVFVNLSHIPTIPQGYIRAVTLPAIPLLLPWRPRIWIHNTDDWPNQCSFTAQQVLIVFSQLQFSDILVMLRSTWPLKISSTTSEGGGARGPVGCLLCFQMATIRQLGPLPFPLFPL